MNSKFIGVLTLAALLTGCALPSAPKEYSSAQAPLFHPASEISSVTLRHTQSVGVLVSDSTVKNVQYLRQYHQNAQSGLASRLLTSDIQQAYINSSDPDLALDWLSTSLNHQFASVTFYDSLDQLIAAHPDVIAMVDTHSKLATERSADVQSSVVVQFFDSSFTYIGQAEGHDAQDMTPVWAHNKLAPQIAAEIHQQRDIQVNALEKFDASLDQLIKAQS